MSIPDYESIELDDTKKPEINVGAEYVQYTFKLNKEPDDIWLKCFQMDFSGRQPSIPRSRYLFWDDNVTYTTRTSNRGEFRHAADELGYYIHQANANYKAELGRLVVERDSRKAEQQAEVNRLEKMQREADQEIGDWMKKKRS